MDFIFDALRAIFFTDIIGNIDLYTILSSLLKYIFVFIVLYFVFLIVRLIFLDIKTVYVDEGVKKSYLQLIKAEGDKREAVELYKLNDFNSIGRDFENDLILDDALVSRRHAIIIWKNDGFYLEDMKSSNGTLLNGQKIDSSVKLDNGDLISLGTYQYKFNRGDELYNES